MRARQQSVWTRSEERQYQFAVGDALTGLRSGLERSTSAFPVSSPFFFIPPMVLVTTAHIEEVAEIGQP